MNVVTPGSSFDLNFVGSCDFGVLGDGTLENTNTNTVTDLTKGGNLDYFDNDTYYGVTISETVKEGEFFKITLYDTESNIIFIGRLFVTAQTNYTINSGNYTQPSADNEYITL